MIKRSWVQSPLRAILAEFIWLSSCKPLLTTLSTLCGKLECQKESFLGCGYASLSVSVSPWGGSPSMMHSDKKVGGSHEGLTRKDWSRKDKDKTRTVKERLEFPYPHFRYKMINEIRPPPHLRSWLVLPCNINGTAFFFGKRPKETFWSLPSCSSSPSLGRSSWFRFNTFTLSFSK